MKHIRPHLLVAAVLAVVLAGGWHGGLRNALADLRFSWLSQPAGDDIVVVAIDAPSIEKIGVWPWPRRLHAELLRQLERAGASDIVFDVDFSTPSDTESDRLFLDALEQAGGSVVLPSFKQPGPDGTTFFNRPLAAFRAQAWSAVVNVAIEPDGLVRRYPFGQKLDGEFMPSMGAVLAGQYDEKSGPFLIDFSIHHQSIPRVSFVDVLNGNQAALDRLKGKKVIIGGTALELGDRFSIPNGGIVAGPVLQALAAESISRGRALHWTSATTTLLTLVALMVAMILLWQPLSAAKRVGVLAVTAVAVELSAYLLQMWFPLVLDTALLHIAAVVYIAAIGLDEIDVRDLLGRIAENRFQRIAMSLGDGLVCTDSDFLITVWNPGATAIFGYDQADMIGRPFDTICATGRGAEAPFSMQNSSALGTGKVIEFDARRRNGEVFPVEASFSRWQGADGLQHGAILRDISVRKREAEKIRYLAEYDSLTGLANRYTLEARLETMIATAEADGAEVALLIIGLDGFQHINDLLGHANGDLVLRAVSDRLKNEVGRAGLVARLSGDEFAVAISRADMSESVEDLARRVTASFEKPVMTGNRSHRVRASIGSAVFPASGSRADELLSNGHIALCRAKASKRGGCVLFEAGIRQEVEARLTLEAELALAADRGEFELYYQPQVHLGSGDLVGAEALIRWHHPTRGLLSPGEFMPVVNTSSVSERVAAWVLETACRQARAWEKSGHRLRVGVNLSPSQLHSGDLASSVANVLAATGLTPSLLELEVTEDILLLDEKSVLATFQRIQQLGVRIVFDDFGTGYASLSYLKKFPLDGLKIDRSFVLNALIDHDDAAIVSSTITLSSQLGLTVIAEGIENRPTADLLASMGCEEGQGYFFARPLPVSEFESRMLVPSDRLAQSLAS
ncbi:EAL domain-containing protein [Bradyrhizobium sp.]|uniref:EAL domain-containing protein n=1 Tax=Bradyrhizobium sp. TaxID=376 RepID=UPI002D704087|nr:EAL domain-containing protein [Bradyrhizobium sp.]HZR77293.1 EAL domain-containing protein [Bradyrhizobium sp.]